MATKTAIRKPIGKGDGGITKSWSFKESLRALRRSLTSSSIQGTSDQPEPEDDSLQRVHFCARDITRCDVWRALSPRELVDEATFPVVPTKKLSGELFASLTGPGSGLLAVSKWSKIKLGNKDLLNSCKTIKNRKAHGISVSLYEKNPLTDRLTGEPNADAFVVRARTDSAFMAIADGVNWGRESMQAARCAIFAVYEYLELRLFGPDSTRAEVHTTKDAAQLLFETLSAAQERIVSCTTGLTTLCVALVLPIDETNLVISPCQSPKSSSVTSSSTSISVQSGFGPDHHSTSRGQSELSVKRFALIVVSVGDSQAFLLSKFHGIREVTGWVAPPETKSPDFDQKCNNPASSPICSSPGTPIRPWIVGGDENRSPGGCRSSSPPERDFRDAGGALGLVHRNGNPELHNLICAVTLCDPGDLVILGTDGLTDNFDPVITRIAMPESPQLDFVDEQGESDTKPDSPDAADREDSCFQGCAHERVTIPARSWYTPVALSPPPQVSIWPRPPPPPITSTVATTRATPPSELQTQSSIAHANFNLASDRPVRFVSKLNALIASPSVLGSPTDLISARSLNFTNQLELNWSERRRYAGKELERVWHETDSTTCSSGRGQASSHDLCEALIRYALNTTESKRKVLQNPEFAQLRAHSSARLKPKDPMCQMSEEELNSRRQWFAEMLKKTPGKLDHATVVAYEVGVYRGDENEVYEETTHGLHIPQKSTSSPNKNEPTKHSTA